MPQGTVKAKRLVTKNGERKIEYLVKPRSKKAEQVYRDTEKIRDLQTSISINRDMMTGKEVEEIKAEIEKLKAGLPR